MVTLLTTQPPYTPASLEKEKKNLLTFKKCFTYVVPITVPVFFFECLYDSKSIFPCDNIKLMGIFIHLPEITSSMKIII